MSGALRCSWPPWPCCSPAVAARSDEPHPMAIASSPGATAEFENRVRPLLADRCLKCHGPRKQESNLRLDSRAAMMQGGDSGPAIVPGRPEREPARQGDPARGGLQMPPDSRLADEQIATLTPLDRRGCALARRADRAPPSAAGRSRPRTAAFWSFRPVRPRTAPEVRGSRLGPDARRSLDPGGDSSRGDCTRSGRRTVGP